MRTDYALLSRAQLQSTSDQQDFLRYPPIAAAAPAAIAPEQAAVWAYPQPGFSDDEIAFTMAGAMLGRVHLSGHLDRMSGPQRELVAEAVRVYRESIRPAIADSAAFWPLGLPRWDAPWIALGLRGRQVSHLTVWRRWPEPGAGAGQITLAVPHLRGAQVTAQVLYPRDAGAGASWNAVPGTVTVTLPRSPSACVLRLAK
jgi:alpha-galactosidase